MCAKKEWLAMGIMFTICGAQTDSEVKGAGLQTEGAYGNRRTFQTLRRLQVGAPGPQACDDQWNIEAWSQAWDNPLEGPSEGRAKGPNKS